MQSRLVSRQPIQKSIIIFQFNFNVCYDVRQPYELFVIYFIDWYVWENWIDVENDDDEIVKWRIVCMREQERYEMSSGGRVLVVGL